MSKEDSPYNNVIELQDGMCDHVKTMRGPKEKEKP